MKTLFIVSGSIVRKGNVLMLKRASTMKYYPNCWEPVSGSIQEEEAGEDTVKREAKEETGLDVQIVKAAPVYEIEGSGVLWVVKPYLLEANSDKVNIEREHSEFQWIEPKKALSDLKLVDGVNRDFKLLGLI